MLSDTVKEVPSDTLVKKYDEIKRNISEILSKFAFWPDAEKTTKEFDSIVFWSENHLFMTLGSAHLFKVYANEEKISNRVGDREERLLMKYLDVHVKFQGVYETLSHVYLPYTLCALLNLYDFSNNDQIVSHAKKLIDIIINQILLVCSDTGVCNLTGSSNSKINTLYQH